MLNYVCVMLIVDSDCRVLPGVSDERLLQVYEEEAEGGAEDDENVAQEVKQRVLGRGLLTLGVL